jgi:hypothetical protein
VPSSALLRRRSSRQFFAVAGGNHSRSQAPGDRIHSATKTMPKSKKSPTTKTRLGRGVCSSGSSIPRGSAPPSGQPVVRPNGVIERTTWRASLRRTLRAGDEIKVHGGPYWEGRAEDGSPVRHRMAERGRMVFRAHCELGGSAWVEATSGHGIVVLHVGHEQPSSIVPGLVRRPYVITKLRKKSEKRVASITNKTCPHASVVAAGRRAQSHHGTERGSSFFLEKERL